MAMNYRPDRNFLTVRELIAELQKLKNQDAPVAISKYSLADKTWEADGVTEIISCTKLKINDSGWLNEREGTEVDAILLY